ncbi:hypothetical protein ACETU7_10815 [Rhodococcus sp. 3Y1]
MFSAMARRAVSVATLPPRLALSGLALVGGSTIPRTAVSDVALRTGTLALAGVGMIPAAAGSIFGAPRIPGSAYVSAAASAINYQPRVRRRIEQRLGRSLTDFALESATSFADVLTYAPASLGVDFGLRTMLLRETLAARNSRRVWSFEPGGRGASTRPDPSGPGSVMPTGSLGFSWRPGLHWLPCPPAVTPSRRVSRFRRRGRFGCRANHSLLVCHTVCVGRTTPPFRTLRLYACSIVLTPSSSIRASSSTTRSGFPTYERWPSRIASQCGNKPGKL